MNSMSHTRYLTIITALAIVIALAVLSVQYAQAQPGPPPAPLHPTATLIMPQDDYAQVRVAWDNPDDPAITGYVINRSDGKEFNSPGQATTYTDHGTEPGTTYTYTVSAESAGGAGPASEATSVRVPDRPAEPSSFSSEIRTPEASHETVWVTLEWQAAPEPETEACEESYPVTGYLLTRTEVDGTTGFTVLPAESLSHTDETAKFSSVYTYLIIATNKIGASYPQAAIINTPARPVMPPTGLPAKVADTFDGNVTLSWTAPTAGPEPAGYRVSRSDGDGDPRVLVQDTGSTDTTYTDPGVSTGVLYVYTVQTLSPDNESPASGPASVEAPLPPVGPRAQPGTGSVELSWTAPEGAQGHSYRVKRRGADETGDDAWNVLATLTETGYSDTSAATDTPYVYSVQSRNTHGGSVWAETGEVVLITRPGAPPGVSAQVEGENIQISWTRPEGRYLDGYEIGRKAQAYGLQATGPWSILTDGLTADSLSHTDTGVTPTVRYTYRLRARNSAGDGPWSEEASAAYVPGTTAPEGVSAQASGTDIVLTWTAEGPYNRGYEVRRRTGEGEWETLERPDPDPGTSHVHSGPETNVVHEYGVRSWNEGGKSDWSGTAQAMIVTPPPAPSGLSAEASGLNIAVSWQAPETGIVDGYDLRMKRNGQDAWTTMQTQTTNHLHVDPDPDVIHTYQVRARNSAGESAWSEVAEAMLVNPPLVPHGLSADADGEDIVVSWTRPETGIVDAYDLQRREAGQEWTDERTEKTSYVHEDVKADTTYEYQVRSRNSAGESGWTDSVSAIRHTGPLPPESVRYMKSILEGYVQVFWTSSPTPDITGYTVRKRVDGGPVDGDGAEPPKGHELHLHGRRRNPRVPGSGRAGRGTGTVVPHPHAGLHRAGHAGKERPGEPGGWHRGQAALGRAPRRTSGEVRDIPDGAERTQHEPPYH